MAIQPHSLIVIGALLLALVTVESGGVFLTRVMQGSVAANALQKSFFRAGHAHAAVLLVLSIVILSVIDTANLSGVWEVIGRYGVPAAAILMPAGFFLSAIGPEPARPNRFMALLWVGVFCVTAGLVVAGVGILVAGISGL
ncbi:hypothetical protein GCM10022287_02290 [Gryllotalpicola koreensis]|uniref:Uncharacterized protein n=2 Tax=Gryllotalpicola koreensis TaxID=993086 RepID=A0ABP7ZQE2_9MICO